MAKTVKDLNKRTRTFCVELYPDNVLHKKAIDTILKGQFSFVRRWCGIKHDKDIYEETENGHKEGDTKKEHWHFVIECENQKTRNSLAKCLKLDTERFIEPCDKYKGALMYLIHYNTEKYQYSVDELLGSAEWISYITEHSHFENPYFEFNALCKFIDEFAGYLPFSAFGQICYKNGWARTLRHYQNFFINAVNDHNKRFSNH